MLVQKYACRSAEARGPTGLDHYDAMPQAKFDRTPLLPFRYN